jgi:hypothetical protein
VAFFKGSYYEQLQVFDASAAHGSAFRGVRARPIADPEPVLEHAVSMADRLDTLSQHYYANPRDWRRIADCNGDELFPEDLIYEDDPPPRRTPLQERMGRVLLVPRRREGR